MIFEIVIKDKKVISCKNYEEELEHTNAKIINFCVRSLIKGLTKYINHDGLENLQDFYNGLHDTQCMSFLEKEFEEDKNIHYAKITIDGETRYYEEW